MISVEGSDLRQWLEDLGSLPCVEQLCLMRGCPLNDQPRGTRRKRTRDDGERLDVEQTLRDSHTPRLSAGG